MGSEASIAMRIVGGAKRELYLISLFLQLVSLSDSILPPVSSKVLKFLLEAKTRALGMLASARESYKPLLVSMLYRNGRPLYSRGDKPIAIRREDTFTARIALVSETTDMLDELISLEARHKTPYGEYMVAVEEILVERLDYIRLPSPSGEPTGVLYVKALTPVVLSSKILVSSDPEIARKIPKVYRLVPSPGLIAAYSLRLWNRVVGLTSGHAFIWRDGWNLDTSMVARAAEVYMAELDYDIRAETVVIGRDDKGRLRRTRGWRGWILYRVKGRRLARLLDKTLALASRIGLGKSRGIGLGDIRAEWRQVKEDKHQ